MSRVLVLGGLGMLGHQLATVLHEHHSVTVAMRDAIEALPPAYPGVEVIGGVDLARGDAVRDLLKLPRWDVVVNAAGVIKHRMGSGEAVDAIAVNSLLPQRLAVACAAHGLRLIHFSTDCVFSGSRDSRRGEDGYRTGDSPDARDRYGLSKLLGEPDGPHCLCLRTSLIGRELRGHHGLVEWYLRQPGDTVKGYTQALFNGLTTAVAARLVDELIRDHPHLGGLWHVGSAPISKFSLLSLLHGAFPGSATVLAADEPYCDRRLDGSAFAERTGWRAPDWRTMVSALATGPQAA